jgi:leader peptidase (prepilin peptidase)/N-methyltransferase
LGIPLIPDRAATRSTTTHWPTGAHCAGRRLLLGGATLAVIVLVVAAAVGAVPVAGAIGVAMLVPAAVFDVEERRLPDAWVGAGAVAVIVTLVVDSVVGQPNDTDLLAGVALGALAMTLPVLALHLVSPASMGFGDVKAAVVLGAAVGTADARLAAVALCLAAAGGAAVGLATRRRTIPFGPFLVVAALLVLLTHDEIVTTIFTGGGPE